MLGFGESEIDQDDRDDVKSEDGMKLIDRLIHGHPERTQTLVETKQLIQLKE